MSYRMELPINFTGTTKKEQDFKSLKPLKVTNKKKKELQPYFQAKLSLKSVESLSREKFEVLEQIWWVFLKSLLRKQEEISWHFQGTNKILTQSCFKSSNYGFFPSLQSLHKDLGK